ncbi:MAG: hypothetical protein WC332_00790 [Clostridia bacterium]|jgi:hypothetical protein
MDITETVSQLNDDDIILLLKVLSCPEGQTEEIYFKERKTDGSRKTQN